MNLERKMNFMQEIADCSLWYDISKPTRRKMTPFDLTTTWNPVNGGWALSQVPYGITVTRVPPHHPSTQNATPAGNSNWSN
jgi:hypothetical protein